MEDLSTVLTSFGIERTLTWYRPCGPRYISLTSLAVNACSTVIDQPDPYSGQKRCTDCPRSVLCARVHPHCHSVHYRAGVTSVFPPSLRVGIEAAGGHSLRHTAFHKVSIAMQQPHVGDTGAVLFHQGAPEIGQRGGREERNVREQARNSPVHLED